MNKLKQIEALVEEAKDLITKPEQINQAFVNRELAKLENEFYRRYRGIAPDHDEFNKAYEQYLKYHDKVKVRWSDKEQLFVETVAQRHTRVARFKCLLIDAIITLKVQFGYIHREQVSATKFCIVQQLTYVN